MKKTITVDEQKFEVEVTDSKGYFEVVVDGEPHRIEMSDMRMNGFNLVLVDGRSLQVNCRMVKDGDYLLTIGHDTHEVLFQEAMIEAAATAGGAIINAPMPGLVAELKIAEGDEVQVGQSLLILEAMKMQNEITAKTDGVVAELHVAQGDIVSIGQKMIVIE